MGVIRRMRLDRLSASSARHSVRRNIPALVFQLIALIKSPHFAFKVLDKRGRLNRHFRRSRRLITVFFMVSFAKIRSPRLWNRLLMILSFIFHSPSSPSSRNLLVLFRYPTQITFINILLLFDFLMLFNVRLLLTRYTR
jgi:hypothetical protein